MTDRVSHYTNESDQFLLPFLSSVLLLNCIVHAQLSSHLISAPPHQACLLVVPSKQSKSHQVFPLSHPFPHSQNPHHTHPKPIFCALISAEKSVQNSL